MWTFLVTILLVSLVGSIPAAAREKELRLPPGAQTRLEPERTVWRLGENVIVRYSVQNVADEPFAVDWQGSRAVRSLRNVVEVYDEKGTLLEDPWPDPPSFGGRGGAILVTKSEPMVIEIAVPRYRVLARPGSYRVRVFHEFGREGSPADDDPRWAETRIQLVEPPIDQIDEMLDGMASLPRHDPRAWRRDPVWSDFETLRHPAYLGALVKRARESGREEPWWLDGIRSIATPEATLALIGLVTDEASVALAEALMERVPEPEQVPGVPVIDRLSPVGPYRQTQERLVREAWRDEFGEPIRAWARAHLGGRNPDWGRHAAYLLAAMGTPEDLPSLLEGIDEALRHSAASPQAYADPVHRARLYYLYLATIQLLRAGVQPPREFNMRGEIVLALLWIREHGPEGLARYEASLGSWLDHEESAIRDLTLRCLLIHPMPPSVVERLAAMLETDDPELRTTALLAIKSTGDPRFRGVVEAQLRRANERRWIQMADAAARGVGVSFAARARIHATALKNETTFDVRLRYLMPAVVSWGWGLAGIPDADERAALERAWTSFVDAHEDALNLGQRFVVDDPAVASLIPSTVEIRHALPDMPTRP